MDWKTLLRGGVTGRNDAYVNEQSPFAKFPLTPKANRGKAPARAPGRKAAVAAAASAPGALWKASVPIPTPRPQQGGTMAGQDRMPNPGQTFAGGDRMPNIGQTFAGGDRMPNIGQTMAGQDRQGPYPTIRQDQPYGLPQPTPPHSMPQHYPQIMQDQGYGLPQPTPPHNYNLPDASEGANPDAGNWWENASGPGGNTQTGQPPGPQPPPNWHQGEGPGVETALFGQPRDRQAGQQSQGGLMELLRHLMSGGQ